MKTLTIPKHLSHVLSHGMILCVICERVCNRAFPCYCHRVTQVTEKREDEEAMAA